MIIYLAGEAPPPAEFQCQKFLVRHRCAEDAVVCLVLLGGAVPKADITVLAPDVSIEVVADRFYSKARNTPFDGWQLCGAVAATVVDGRVVYRNDAVSGAETFSWSLR